MAGAAQPQGPGQEPRRGEPPRRGVRLRRGVQGARPRRGQAGHRRGADDLAGLVAGGLRPLRPVHDPDGVAQRRHVPHHRRPRRRGRRPAALRPAQQLAGQRQPRQGAPAAVAGQEEVRPEPLVGGPDGPHRQRRAGVDGLRDVRLRRRSRGRLGARRGRLLGPRDRVAGRRALQRRPRPRGAVRRGPDGPDLRQPGGAERQPGPARLGRRHPRDVSPHGDERRGDGRADRRRAHVRQDARRGRSRRVRRPRARGRPARGAGPRLAQLVRLRQGRGHDHERHRGHLDLDADDVVERLLREPVRLRVGAEQEPGRSAPVGGEGRRRRRHDPGSRTRTRRSVPRRC